MTLTIKWTPEAAETYDRVISYLKAEWTEKELEAFEEKCQHVYELIKTFPKLFRYSPQYDAHKALITKHNILYYRVNPPRIELLSFWDTRQDPDLLFL